MGALDSLKGLLGIGESGREDRQLILNPQTEIVYAVGDVHGCLDLLLKLEGRIEADASARGLEPTIILLGDFIDRGPNSAQVIDHVISRQLKGHQYFGIRGNHEDWMIEYLENPVPRSAWLSRGGQATLQSYGIQISQVRTKRSAVYALEAHIPDEHVSFLRSLPNSISTPVATFEHAPRSEPRARSNDRGDARGQVVHEWIVHGHVAVREASIVDKRINVDTGAFATGRLSAAGIMTVGPPFTLFVDRQS